MANPTYIAGTGTKNGLLPPVITYRKITWTHENSGISGSDDWHAPVAS